MGEKEVMGRKAEMRARGAIAVVLCGFECLVDV